MMRQLLSSTTFKIVTKESRRDLILCGLTLFVSTLLGIWAVSEQARFMDFMHIHQSATPELWKVFWMFVILQLGYEVTQFLRRTFQNSISVRTAEFLKIKIFEKALTTRLSDTHGTHTGDITQRFSSDSVLVGSIWAEGILSFLTTLLLALSVSVVLSFHIGVLGMIFLLTLFVLVYLAQKFSKLSSPFLQRRFEHSGQRIAEIQGGIQSIKTVKMLQMEQFVLGRALRFAHMEQGARVETNAIGCKYIPVFASLRWIAWFVTLFFLIYFSEQTIGQQGNDGNQLVGMIFAVFWYSNLLQEAFLMIGAYLNFMQVGAVAVERLDNFFAKEIATSPLPQPSGPNVVEFVGATFEYPGRPPVLSRLTLDIKRGSFVGVVGRFGSGKTSFIRAILQELNCTSGELKIDKNVSAALVTQDAFLYSAAVRDTLRFKFQNDENEDRTLHEILETTDFASDLQLLENGLATFVGERGVTLSGGQRQRLALARMAYFDRADLLLLDDPFYALDRKTAERVSTRLLLERWNGKTRIVATHRLESVKYADLIVILENGRIVERGSHQDLLKSSDIYKELWENSALTEQKSAPISS